MKILPSDDKSVHPPITSSVTNVLIVSLFRSSFGVNDKVFYRATLYTSAVYAVVLCLCLSDAGIVSKLLHESSCFLREGLSRLIPHCVLGH